LRVPRLEASAVTVFFPGESVYPDAKSKIMVSPVLFAQRVRRT